MPKRTPRRYADEDDDLEEETPRRRRRSRDEEDEAPRRRRSRSRDEDEDEDDEEDEPPRRSRRSRDEEDDEEDEAPRRSRRRSRDDDDEEEDDEPPRRSRRSRDAEDDEDDAEDDRGRGKKAPKLKPLRSGWSGLKVTQAKATDFPAELKLTDEEQVVAFLEDEPFVTYVQHWIDERDGKKSFICLEENCPLCDIGSDTRAMAVFNLALITDGNEPEVMQLVTGPLLFKALESHAMSKHGPLSNGYYTVSKTGGGQKGKVSYNIGHIKARDLDEDYKLEPLSDEEFEDLAKKLYTAKDVQRQTRKELSAVADELV